jgi:hypothetical protein
VAGDRSKYAGSGATFLTPPLQHTTHYWAEVISACGTTATDTITVRVGGSKTRAVRH